MVKSLQGNYGIPGKEQYTIAIDLAQMKFHCCGINSDINYDTSLWRLQGYGQKDLTVPLTCCILNNNNHNNNGNDNNDLAYLDPKPKNLTLCQSLQKFDYEKARYTQSCLDKIDFWYRQQYILFLGASLIIAIIEFCVLLSIILNCTKIAKKSHKCKQNFNFELDTNINDNDNNTRFNKSSNNNPISIMNENIYETDLQHNNHNSIQNVSLQSDIIPTEIREVYIQPQEYNKNKHNTTFKPSKNQYHISKSYLV